jgi:hypothetical protein
MPPAGPASAYPGYCRFECVPVDCAEHVPSPCRSIRGAWSPGATCRQSDRQATCPRGHHPYDDCRRRHHLPHTHRRHRVLHTLRHSTSRAGDRRAPQMPWNATLDRSLRPAARRCLGENQQYLMKSRDAWCYSLHPHQDRCIARSAMTSSRLARLAVLQQGVLALFRHPDPHQAESR